MPTSLIKSDYQTLLGEISAIYENAQKEAVRAVNQVLILAYWEIGKRIVTVEQKNDIRAAYGGRLIENLSRDLEVKYGKGFSPRNLANMRKFFLSYPILQTSAKLDWTHYQILSAIKDPDERVYYEKKTESRGLSVRELRQELRQNKVSLDEAALPLSQKEEPSKTHLTFKRGQLNLVRLVDVKDIHTGISLLEADVGFYHTLPVSLERFKDPRTGQLVELVTGSGSRSVRPQVTGSSGKVRVRPTEAPASQRYTYQAFVREVIDGDTLKVKIPMGRSGCVHPTLRLKDIDCPELTTKKGQEARGFVEERLKTVPFIIIKTHYLEAYHRYVVDVWYLPGVTDPHQAAAEGIYLNQELIDAGLATVV